jgi:hypothetical protein
VGTPVHSWICGGCGRRVPLRIEVCHCGATRQQTRDRPAAAPEPEAAAGVGGGWRSLPGDVQALLAAAVLTVLLGIGWLLYSPPEPPRLPALLGYVDAPLPPPSRPPPPRPPFRMPWWR